MEEIDKIRKELLRLENDKPNETFRNQFKERLKKLEKFHEEFRLSDKYEIITSKIAKLEKNIDDVKQKNKDILCHIKYLKDCNNKLNIEFDRYTLSIHHYNSSVDVDLIKIKQNITDLNQRLKESKSTLDYLQKRNISDLFKNIDCTPINENITEIYKKISEYLESKLISKEGIKPIDEDDWSIITS